MPVKLILRDKAIEARPNMTLRDALLKAGVNPESVLGVRNGAMITDDEILREGDVVKLVAVISGGSSHAL
jgi:sulfur carrier protein ThiS